jgi:crotonobetainyl-CoA:carnitine CoA-transferase CaiB-like acyl-CoA transferase
MEKLEKADIAFARVSDCALLSAHPHLRRIEVVAPSGPVAMPAPAPLFDEQRLYGAIPELGEHTERIRAEFLPR